MHETFTGYDALIPENYELVVQHLTEEESVLFFGPLGTDVDSRVAAADPDQRVRTWHVQLTKVNRCGDCHQTRHGPYFKAHGHTLTEALSRADQVRAAWHRLF